MKNRILLTAIISALIIESCVIFYQQIQINKHSINNVIYSRKSVRHYIEDKQIEDKYINELIKSAMAAPTAGNKQPWEFIVVKDRTVLNKIAEKMPYAKFLKFAPLAIIVAGNTDRTLADEAKELWIQDTSAATQNLLLAAESMGLGAVWTAVYPMQQRINDLSEIVNLPKNVIPLNVVVLGYPTGVDKPKNKYNSDYIHYEKY